MLSAGVAAVVELVEFERLDQITHVRLGCRDLGVVGALEHIGNDQGGEHANDEQHHHQFDKREAALARLGRQF